MRMGPRFRRMLSAAAGGILVFAPAALGRADAAAPPATPATAARLHTDAGHPAEALARQMDEWTAVPAGFPPSGATPRDDWPGHCIKALDIAIVQGDLAAAKQWARELASAACALCDLHRWLDLLVDDELAALAFQARGRSLFADLRANLSRANQQTWDRAAHQTRRNGTAFRNHR